MTSGRASHANFCWLAHWSGNEAELLPWVRADLASSFRYSSFPGGLATQAGGFLSQANAEPRGEVTRNIHPSGVFPTKPKAERWLSSQFPGFAMCHKVQFRAPSYRENRAHQKEQVPSAHWFCLMRHLHTWVASAATAAARFIFPKCCCCKLPELYLLKKAAWQRKVCHSLAPTYISISHSYYFKFQRTVSHIYSILFYALIWAGFSSLVSQKPRYASNSSSSLAPLSKPIRTRPFGRNISSLC